MVFGYVVIIQSRGMQRLNQWAVIFYPLTVKVFATVYPICWVVAVQSGHQLAGHVGRDFHVEIVLVAALY